jgi:hypothetical protein
VCGPRTCVAASTTPTASRSGSTRTSALEEMTVDGATIAWSDTGSGEPTLLVHAGVFGAWFAPQPRGCPVA